LIKIGFMHRQVGFYRPVHAKHADELRAAGGKCAQAHERQCAGRAGSAHDAVQAGASFLAGIDQPTTAIKNRTPRRANQRRSSLNAF